MEKSKRKIAKSACFAVFGAFSAIATIGPAAAFDQSPEIAGSTVYAGPPAAYCHCRRSQTVSHESFGFGPGMGYSVENKAPHNGFDLNGDGVHPPIGPITD